MLNQKQIKILIKKNTQNYIKKFLKKKSNIILRDSLKSDFLNFEEESYMIYENDSELIIKVNVKLNRDMADDLQEQSKIHNFSNFLKNLPDKILKFLNIEPLENDKTIGFK